MNKRIVISLGGSLIYPNGGPNIEFLTKFNQLIRGHLKKGASFIIIAGGGKISRNYQQAAKQVIGKLPDEDSDWLGTHVTRMNAQLLRTIFTDVCHPKVIQHYDVKEPQVNKPILIAAGWKPGWSTDYCSVLLAKDYGATSVINLSNIDVVYDKDPKVYPNAKPIKRIGWDDFEKIVGDKWSPGANLPFDPVATKLAKGLNLTVFILKGNDIDNLERLLANKPFKGTIIMPSKIDAAFYNREYYELGIGYSGYTTTTSGRFFTNLTNLYRALKIKLFLNPKTVLDAGCGMGLLVYYLRKLGVKAYGVEVSNYAISKADPTIRDYISRGSVLDLPYFDNQFEVVVSVNVLEHLKTKLMTHALQQCNRVSNKFIIHKIYTKENTWISTFHQGDPSHISVFPKQWWINLFKKLGFKQTRVFYPNLPQFMETIFVLEKKKTEKKNASS